MKHYAVIILFSFYSLALADQTVLNYSDQSYLVVFKYEDSSGKQSTDSVTVGSVVIKMPTQPKASQPNMPPPPLLPPTLEPGKETLYNNKHVIEIGIYASGTTDPNIEKKGGKAPIYSDTISYSSGSGNKTFSIYKGSKNSLIVQW